jgi:hypothetical protein
MEARIAIFGLFCSLIRPTLADVTDGIRGTWFLRFGVYAKEILKYLVLRIKQHK